MRRAGKSWVAHASRVIGFGVAPKQSSLAIYLPVGVVQESSRSLPQVQDERRALLAIRSLDYSNIASAREGRRLER